jgi:hypothetical protein
MQELERTMHENAQRRAGPPRRDAIGKQLHWRR